MPTPQPPTNYQWVGNQLSYTLPTGTVGLKLKYKQLGTSIWIIVYDSPFNAPLSITLPSNLGPTGTIWGATSKTASEGWGEPDEEEITNTPT